MTAQEMFERLGFTKNKSSCYNDTHILYEKVIAGGTDIEMVKFKDGCFVYTSSSRFALKTDGKILNAIYNQMEELGWIE